jgi:electron transfer flavoprotein alpha subunit
VSGVLVIAETRRGTLRDVSLELVGAALALHEQGCTPVRVAVVDANPAPHADALRAPGVEEVLTVASPLEHFEPHLHAEAVLALIRAVDPDVVLTAHSVDGMGFAPAVAAVAGFGLATDVTGLSWEDGALVARRGVYGARLVATLEFPASGGVVLMLRPGEHPAATGAGTAPVRDADVHLDPALAAVEHLGYREADEGDVDITRSDFLLAIGRGVEEEGRIEQFVRLADDLGATLSVSRPLVDAGWVTAARQVGQSGKTVAPKVYLALGISGAVQHTTGIRNAETIIAINTDPEAPIFQLAHYGAVADLFDVADALPDHFG